MTISDQFNQVLREWTEVFMRRSMHDFKRFMDENGLSPSQVNALMQLHHCGDCGISDIGAHLGVTSAAASQMVDRMVQQGLFERSEDSQDRRIRHVALTTQGKQLIEGGIEARRHWLEQLTSTLTPEHQAAIIAALTLLTESARKLDV